jgi:hypothetical protein
MKGAGAERKRRLGTFQRFHPLRLRIRIGFTDCSHRAHTGLGLSSRSCCFSRCYVDGWHTPLFIRVAATELAVDVQMFGLHMLVISALFVLAIL